MLDICLFHLSIFDENVFTLFPAYYIVLNKLPSTIYTIRLTVAFLQIPGLFIAVALVVEVLFYW